MNIIKKEKYKLLLYFLTYSLFISGCSIKDKNFHRDMMKIQKSRINSKNIKETRESLTQKLIKENTYIKKDININNDKFLSTVLNELEKINNKTYFLKSKDFLIPKSNLRIKNIKELKKYLSITMNKKLTVIDKGILQIVVISNLNTKSLIDLQKIPFKMKGTITISSLIDIITDKSGFEFIFNKEINEKQLKKINETQIQINTNNILDAINLISENNNFFIDIDYNKEKIYLSKYKHSIIEINIPIFSLDTENEIKTQETSGISTIKHTAIIKIFDSLNKMLTKLVKDNPKTNYDIDQSSGIINFYGNKEQTKTLKKLVSAYEKSFSKEATITFERIEIILNKNQEYGISEVNEKSSKGLNSLTTSTSSASNLSYTGKLLKSSDILNITAKANNELGYMLNYSKNVISLRNNIPVFQSLSQNKDYIEKIESSTSTTNNTVSNNIIVNTMKDGSLITAIAKISKNKIFLNINPNIKKLINFNGFQIGGNTIELPEYKSQNYNISKDIYLGETKLVGSMIVHDDASDYKSILPIDNFALGGSDKDQYVRREILYYITLNEIKGF